MTFFNKKEEVIDIQLTQFGKDLLSRGYFKPEYYQFFDDDILYNSSCAGFSEEQNEAEIRILTKTPKMKTQHLTTSIEERYAFEQENIISGDRERFLPIKKRAIPEIQEKILKYPLASQEFNSQDSPRFNIINYGSKFENVSFSTLTGSGIVKKDPIIHINPIYTIKEDRSNLQELRMVNDETFIDLNSKEIVFRDNSRIYLESQAVTIDIQELAVFDSDENFEFSVYEILQEEGSNVEVKKKIDSLDQIRKLFSIKTDEDISSAQIKHLDTRNGYKRGEGN